MRRRRAAATAGRDDAGFFVAEQAALAGVRVEPGDADAWSPQAEVAAQRTIGDRDRLLDPSGGDGAGNPRDAEVGGDQDHAQALPDHHHAHRYAAGQRGEQLGVTRGGDPGGHQVGFADRRRDQRRRRAALHQLGGRDDGAVGGAAARLARVAGPPLRGAQRRHRVQRHAAAWQRLARLPRREPQRQAQAARGGGIDVRIAYQNGANGGAHTAPRQRRDGHLGTDPGGIAHGNGDGDRGGFHRPPRAAGAGGLHSRISTWWRWRRSSVNQRL